MKLYDPQHKTRAKYKRVRCPHCGSISKVTFEFMNGTQEVLQVHLQCLDLHATLNTGEKFNNWIYQTFKTGEIE